MNSKKFHLKGDIMYSAQNEINSALQKLISGKITKTQYKKIVEIYKPIQD